MLHNKYKILTFSFLNINICNKNEKQIITSTVIFFVADDSFGIIFNTFGDCFIKLSQLFVEIS